MRGVGAKCWAAVFVVLVVGVTVGVVVGVLTVMAMAMAAAALVVVAIVEVMCVCVYSVGRGAPLHSPAPWRSLCPQLPALPRPRLRHRPPGDLAPNLHVGLLLSQDAPFTSSLPALGCPEP